MQRHLFHKEYIAICEGTFKKANDTINLPIARKPNSIIERCVNDNGDASVTEYFVLESKNNISVLRCILKTGRTHQIRVHLSHIGHPIIGDTLYGSASPLIKRQALHSYKIRFILPTSKKEVEYVTSLPNDMKFML